ncbi:MAG: UDP-N-acetylglucosamine--N-acetylmuramyl-(pentapeptide) pyrophosphoryl-undecaprenol N-acetylglucosamine transferase [Candidatus Levyibacteriota bacterium]
MKAVFTGGHLSPLLAVLDVMPKDIDLLVIGRKYALEGDKVLSLEYQTLNKEKVRFENITAARLQRKFTRHTLAALFKFPLGFVQSLLILLKFKPEVVLSFGGYVSLPVTLASFVLGIPVVIHEQTLEAGLSNRISSFFAKKICISWETSRKFFPKSKVVMTGNPVREFSIFNFKFSISDEKIPLVYVTGGSSGSHAINLLIEGCLEKLLVNCKIIHQTGGAKEYNDLERLKKIKDSLNQKFQKRYFLAKFIEPCDVGSIVNASDLVVSRSGISTITELLFFAKPSLLIPLPFSQNNEQKKNALLLQNLGLGEIIDQEKTSCDLLYDKMIEMLNNIEKYKKSREVVKTLIKKDAAQKLIEVCYAQKKN